MNVVLVIVMSVDGKTTRWNTNCIYEWTSKEDQEYFFSLIEKSKVIIMGRITFEGARSIMKLKPGKLRVVMTRRPGKYADLEVAGQLEFVDELPGDLIRRLEAIGYEEVLLVGGESINSLFLREKLVDEVWVSVEPFVFGSGNGLVGNEELDVRMELKSVKRMNERGSLLLKYRVV